MIVKRRTKKEFRKAIFGCLFAIMMLITGVFGVFGQNTSVFAEVVNSTNNANNTNNTNATREQVRLDEDMNAEDETDAEEEEPEEPANTTPLGNGDSCKNSLGAIGWLVCPTTGKIAEAVDWLYDKIEEILIIKPISVEDGSPIYEIWKYCRGITNMVFIIFLLVVIYSQITGYGINNYGIKKALPKLIVAAILVNLSFLICSLAVDCSNIIGSGLRSLFTAIEESTLTNVLAEKGATMTATTKLSYASMFSSLAGGAALTVLGGVIAFETGAIWMLIPVVLGALVAVASGLITIALRQAVVALLIMISPLAIVAYILPNTEKWFKKWKDLLMKMLVFYPMFSLLFGASSLAGFAIIASASDGFGILLGVAVQVFPLFFSWSLMKMSGTFLSDINARLQGLAARPLAASRGWADSRRQLAKQKHLASGKAYTPSLRLMQFINNRRIAREADMDEYAKLAHERGMAYRARKHYDRKGVPTRAGERAYRRQAESMEYQRVIARDANNMEEGLAEYAKKGTLRHARLEQLDIRNINAADSLNIEKARGHKIEYENARGFHQRMEDAINAHMDDEHGGNSKYKMHDIKDRDGARARYNVAAEIMKNNDENIHFAAANAAKGFEAQKKIVEATMGEYFSKTPATQDVNYRLDELTTKFDATKNERVADRIDLIMPGLRILNQRGDTDMVRKQLENILNNGGGVDLGTHASQSLASFLMFEVKDGDPFLRRFGKYINLETARVYNTKDPNERRQNPHLTLDEYITGEYEDWEYNNPTKKIVGKAKRPMDVLIEGTSLDNVERTAYANLDEMLVNAYTKNGQLDIEKYLKRRKEIETAMGPAFISASLKYLSGSEPLKSAVSFLTGYNGDKPRWEDEKDPLYRSNEAKDYFRGKSIDYLSSQTPTQILSLRSDYYKALQSHLIDEYELTDMKGWDQKAIDEHRELMREKAEIQTRYGDLPAEEAMKKRDADMKELKDKMAGAEFRQILDSKGKLNQIYRTRTSGAANNAKDWVRKWLGLDDEISITMKLDEDRKRMKALVEEERKKRNARQMVDDSGVPDSVYGPYSDTDRAMFISQINDMWQDLKGEDGDVFFEESMKYLKQILGEDSAIVIDYKRFREDDKYADGHMLKCYLEDLLSDPENY